MESMSRGGGGTSFTVDAGAISGHGLTVGQVADRIEEDMRLLQGKLQALQGQWTGQAATAFAELYHRWDTEQRDMKEVLRQISTALGSTAGDYAETERRNQAMFSASRR